jgi:hypothetical protein
MKLVKYGAFGIAGVIILMLIYTFLKKLVIFAIIVGVILFVAKVFFRKKT